MAQMGRRDLRTIVAPHADSYDQSQVQVRPRSVVPSPWRERVLAPNDAAPFIKRSWPLRRQ